MDSRTLVMHQAMLADRTRLRAYDQALAEAVRPGDIVIDVGAGLLALGMMALRHGAAHVYAVEGDPVTAAVAARIADDNGLSGKLTVLQGDACTVDLPERADVIVAELMGNIGPEEQMPEILAAVAGGRLAPGGRVVPQRLTTTLTAIEFDDEGWGVWSGARSATGLTPCRTTLSRPRTCTSSSGHRSCSAHPCRSGTASRLHRPRRHEFAEAAAGAEARHAARRDGLVDRVPGPRDHAVELPVLPGCNWGVWIWPLRHTPVVEGDTLRVRVLVPEGVRVATDWRLECGISRRERTP